MCKITILVPHGVLIHTIRDKPGNLSSDAVLTLFLRPTYHALTETDDVPFDATHLIFVGSVE